MEATVTLSIRPAVSFELVEKCGYTDDSYLNGVKNGIIMELLSHPNPALKVEVSIDDLGEHATGSSFVAFSFASLLATRELLGDGLETTNIRSDTDTLV